VQLVGQFVRHLRGETRSFVVGCDSQNMTFADEDDLAPDFITDGDLVGSIAMDVRTHCPPPLLRFPVVGHGSRRDSDTPDALNIQRPLGRRGAESREDQLTN